MNYAKIYNAIIDRSYNRTLNTYTERHHIIPRCFGGSNEITNIAILTSREHFICHLLLYKMQTTKRAKHQMLTAVIMMKGKDINNSKLYEHARKTFSKMHSDSISGVNHPMYGTARTGKDNPFYGKTHTVETRKKLSDSRSGMIMAKDTRDGQKKWITKEDFETHNFYVGATSGNTLSDETKRKISEAQKKKQVVKCPHCGKEGTINMSRYHFDNCKKYILANDFSIAKL